MVRAFMSSDDDPDALELIVTTEHPEEWPLV